MRVGNNYWQPRNLIENGQSDSLSKGQHTLIVGFDEGGVVGDKDDDECEPIKLSIGICYSDSGY